MSAEVYLRVWTQVNSQHLPRAQPTYGYQYANKLILKRASWPVKAALSQLLLLLGRKTPAPLEQPGEELDVFGHTRTPRRVSHAVMEPLMEPRDE